jgi:hypothetical protein
VCHQSVGLIARAIEAAGIPTTSLTSAWSITRSANPPRALFLDFPLGHTAGPPDDADAQLGIARAALEAAYTIDEPGTIVPLASYVWPEEWKTAARSEGDVRTPRFDTPQYQTEEDRHAAIAAHGEALACAVCAAADVPVT